MGKQVYTGNPKLIVKAGRGHGWRLTVTEVLRLTNIKGPGRV